MNNTNWIIFIVAIIVLAIVFIWPSKNAQAPNTGEEHATTTGSQDADVMGAINNNATTTVDMPQVLIKTNKGDITVELYSTESPKTVENFLKLVNEGFYDGTRFHRVIKGFMIQGGDPLSKELSKQSQWGTGGPGYTFADEINSNADIYKTGYKRGVLAMANSGPNTNGSQFFIMQADYPLLSNYTIFGKVVDGLDTVDAIATVKTTGAPYDRPLDSNEVVIEKMTEVK
jgi:cyclophilin family peptidyl-prolyl cis-trans isomerase